MNDCHYQRMARRCAHATLLSGLMGACLIAASAPALARVKLLEPDVATAPARTAAGYVLDPAFNGGAFFLDRFAGPDNANYRGRKLVQLPSGDVVVAGLVPRFNQPDQPDGYANVGLVRYDSAGQRVAWTFNSIYGNFGNQYLIYPGSQTDGQLSPRFSAIKDIKAIGDRIYVMVDHSPVGESRDVHLLVFSDEGAQSGRFLGHFGLFAGAFNEDGAALAVFDSLGDGQKLLAAGTVFGGSGNYISVTRFDIGGAVTLAPDAGFGTMNVFLRQDAGGCSSGVAVAGACPIVARSIALGFRGFTGAGPIYIGADRQWSAPATGSNDWDAAVVKLDSSGEVETGFGAGTGAGGGGGFAFVQFDRGDKEDRNRAIAVRTLGIGLPANPYRDEIFAVASVAQGCASGTGVGKLDDDGHYVSSFGTGGKLRFGGWDDPGDPQACAVYGPTQPFAVARDGTTLAIAGQTDAEVGPDFIASPMLALVDGEDGSVDQVAAVAVEAPWANFPGDGALYGVVASGGGRFTAAGDARDPTTGHTLMFATARFGNDAIFADGFE